MDPAQRPPDGEPEPADGISVEQRLIGAAPVVAVTFDFAHHGGTLSTGNVSHLAGAATLAARRRVPLVSFVASGGVRVQQGMAALAGLQQVTAAAADLRRAGVPHLAVLRGPVAGGAWALFAGAADVIVAHAGAQIGFAGSRVRPAGADPAAYTAEAKWAAGEVDAVVAPADEQATLERYLRVLGPVAADRGSAVLPELPPLPPGASQTGTGWQAVRLARDPARPRARAYLDAYFDVTAELSGDRAGGRGGGLLAGVGLRAGRPLAYLAQDGSATTAAGFRTAARVARLAQRWGTGILTLIDTPGAASDAAAERSAVGTAIGELLMVLAELTVPVTSVLIGEGGSGGALALAAPGHLWAVPSSYFSVIGPEGAAALLYRDASRAADAADQLRLGPAALLADGLVNGVLPDAPA
jgi:acetyl-CoA carboxylase carboxyl transferase subunit beta